MGAKVDLNVRIAPDVKEQLVADARDQGASINDVAAGILAEHFGVTFRPSGRRSPGAREEATGAAVLRVSPTLYRKIELAAMRRNGDGKRSSKVRVVDAVLRAHYALDAVAA